MVSSMDEPERFQHGANIGRSFASATRRDLGAPIACGEATLGTQLIAKALQALSDVNSPS